MKTAKSAKGAKGARGAKGVRASRARRPRLRLTVQYATRAQNVPDEKDFERWARAALSADAEVTLRIVGESEGRELNRSYRGKDYATNVLTFVMNGAPPDARNSAQRAGFRYEGDVALCAPVVTKEARTQKKDVIAHYAHLTVHGMLHLQGYDHEDALEAEQMENLEKRILKRLGYPDPYASLTDHGPTP
jgi:probable rRNA maturation factor